MKLFVGAKGLVHYNGKILLLRESSKYIDGTGKGRWDVPGGRIEIEEEVKVGLLREIQEESGLTVTPGKLLGVYDGFPTIGEEKCHIVRLYFLCEAQSDAVTLSNDHDAFDWVDPQNIKEKHLMDDIEEMLMEAQKHL